MNRLALVLLTAASALSTVFADDEPREWYNGIGNVSRLPVYRLINLQPVNAVGTMLLFACSAATRDAVHLSWRVQHPAWRELVAQHPGPLLRELGQRGFGKSVTSSQFGTKLNQSVQEGSFDAENEQQTPSMSANYSVLASVNIQTCLTLGDDYCPRDRAFCSADQAQGLSCLCSDAFPRRDPFHGVCYTPVKLGNPCLFDHECESEHSWCLHQVCTCRPLHRPVAHSCEPVARLGEPCQKNQCAAPYTVCKNGRCGCQDRSDDVDGVCAPVSSGDFAGGTGATGFQNVKAFGPLRTDAPTLLMLTGIGVVLGIITMCYTLKDFGYRSMKATTAVSAEGPLPQANALNGPTS
ncbi:hypothetical protein HPB51_010757 [Rhipicephalus microplus]|uniref:EB domain-containing protein n=1 Tax=Rhipicephalus microplus TaxID=6941 RepID=A0A9J6DUL4_RHIMP|nr:hypothetical protein HPB51_010757 [Rhipicephalus microplus]